MSDDEVNIVLGEENDLNIVLEPATPVGDLQDTDELPEGVNNLYYTKERVEDDSFQILKAGSNISISHDDQNDEIEIGFSGATGGIDVEDDALLSVENATALNFANGLAVTDDGDGSVTVEGGNSGAPLLTTGMMNLGDTTGIWKEVSRLTYDDTEDGTFHLTRLGLVLRGGGSEANLKIRLYDNENDTVIEEREAGNIFTGDKSVQAAPLTVEIMNDNGQTEVAEARVFGYWR